MRLELPQPHPAQLEILRNARRFNVLRCGRRFGKTALGILLLVGLVGVVENRLLSRGILQGYPVCWVAPTYKYLVEAWREVRRILRPLEVHHSATDRRIEYRTGGVLEFWSADRGDVARSRKYSLMIIDEAAVIRNLKEEWEESMLPSLADMSGSAFFLSTPKGTNDFRELDDIASGDNTGAWYRAKHPTYANPYIDKAEIEMLRQTMDRLSFLQEIEAEFVESGGLLMRPSYIRTVEQPPDETIVARAMGVDLAISKSVLADYTAAIFMSLTTEGRFIVTGAERGRMGFSESMGFIRSCYERWKPNAVAVEKVAYQQAAIETLQSMGIPVQPIVPVKDKASRFMPLLAQYEQGRVDHAETLPDWFERELLMFPEGDHDDSVDAAVYSHSILPSQLCIQVG